MILFNKHKVEFLTVNKFVMGTPLPFPAAVPALALAPCYDIQTQKRHLARCLFLLLNNKK
jgi:hypothetical protein